MDQDITFEFEGVTYTVSHEAYGLDKIVLPDSRVIGVEAWVETEPPTPEGLYEIDHAYRDRSVVQVANLMEAVIAVVKE